MKLELFVPELPILPNQLLGAKWFIRASNAKKWRRLIERALLSYQGDMWLITELPLQKSQIHLTRHSSRQCDFDGLVGGFKPVLDALVKLKIIEDDTPQHIECTYEWAKSSRKEAGVRIVVEAPSIELPSRIKL